MGNLLTDSEVVQADVEVGRPNALPNYADRSQFESRRWETGLLLLVVVLLSSTWLWIHLTRGWIPHDDGALAQSAERVLHGQLPHRDFDELYTGGLTFLNAAAFRVFGVNLAALRYALFFFFVAWVPAVFYICSRFVRTPIAAFATLVCVAWSVPNYPAAMPSWYNLFFATFGLAALMRFIEVSNRRWLFVAGICGGVSVVTKSIGLYYICGVLLFLAFREQCESKAGEDAEPSGKWNLYSLCLLAATGALCLGLVALVRSQHSLFCYLLFVVPQSAVCAVLVVRERRMRFETHGRFKRIVRLLVPFLFGISIPLAIFLVPYVLQGALISLLRGLFVLPLRRLTLAAFTLPMKALLEGLGCDLLIILLAYRARKDLWLRPVVPILFAILFAATYKFPAAFHFSWFAIYTVVPLLIAVSVVALARRSDHSMTSQRVFAVLGIMSFCSLVQYPYAVPIYFCYVAPLVVIAMIPLLGLLPKFTWLIAWSIAIYILLFGSFRLYPALLWGLGAQPFQSSLDTTRGKILVTSKDAATYNPLIALVQQHAQGDYIYATPDCPEVYFLTGKRNPTRSLFDFFEDQEQQSSQISSAIQSGEIKLVVINQRPGFSNTVSPQRLSELRSLLPYSSSIDKFEVRWR